MDGAPTFYQPDDISELTPDPKFTVQLILGRTHAKEQWVADITLWDWINMGNAQVVTTQHRVCAMPVPNTEDRCFGLVVKNAMCSKCHTVFSPEEAEQFVWSNVVVTGDSAWLADIVDRLLLGINGDADVLAIYLDKQITSRAELLRYSPAYRMHDDVLDNCEYRQYTRTALLRDSLQSSVNQCLRTFLHA